MLAALVLAGILTQGCSDNNGRVTPSSATTVGDALGGPAGAIVVQVTVNPGSIDRGRRGSVLAIVTNANGIGVAGKPVQLTTTIGRLDQTSGVTDAAGLFSTTIAIPCEALAGVGGVVTAIVEGKVSTGGAFTPVTSATNDPCA